ncbi:MAG TPA: Gfo/Idh/MocA family oxidoreductase [Thermoguttaceae bacterium]|nr:Gfo/Idh/MocA family oxidoreductase [Thermoguttaceae bacterium]
MKIRVGLIGLGEAWEHRYAPALRALADSFEVRAVCDPVGHRAAQVARQFGAVVVDGYHALAAHEDVDAIMLLAPGWFGSLPLLAACAAGKAVYCGAELDLPLAEAQRIRRCAEERGVAFMAEFVRRHAPATLRLKELIATHLGPPQLLFSHHRLSVVKKANGCGAPPQDPIRRELVELVDWCCYVVGRWPRRVSGIVHHQTPTRTEDDYRMLSMDFSEEGEPGSGPIAQISCGRYIPARWHEAVGYRPLAELQVSCERGIAFIDLPSTLVWFDEAGRHQEILDSERPVGEQLLTQFHRAVTSRACEKPDLNDVCGALMIVQEASRSFREGHRVDLP